MFGGKYGELLDNFPQKDQKMKKIRKKNVQAETIGQPTNIIFLTFELLLFLGHM
jgi:hypothetical protein